ncbi:MAG TPA: hypothetical protein DCY79_10890 [Planctomycetaceae bacterium]|nr:hypothetical protein [Blastopirellula sp.]HAY80301.1 hypothetical protein [Planctomycetaceae bacterium]|tara:strand:- start:417 stop:608 length:192 start_codon:yes stop_codon:yes gene_type:complete
MKRSKRKDSLPKPEMHQQIMQRITRRYEQLDEELSALESQLPQFEEDESGDTPGPRRRRRKPR